MATPTQIIFTKIAAFAMAIGVVTWLRIDGVDWIVTIAVGVGAYVLFKTVIAVLIGLREGFALRAEGKRRASGAEDLAGKIAEAIKGLPPAEQEAVAKRMIDEGLK